MYTKNFDHSFQVSDHGINNSVNWLLYLYSLYKYYIKFDPSVLPESLQWRVSCRMLRSRQLQCHLRMNKHCFKSHFKSSSISGQNQNHQTTSEKLAHTSGHSTATKRKQSIVGISQYFYFTYLQLTEV